MSSWWNFLFNFILLINYIQWIIFHFLRFQEFILLGLKECWIHNKIIVYNNINKFSLHPDVKNWNWKGKNERRRSFQFKSILRNKLWKLILKLFGFRWSERERTAKWNNAQVFFYLFQFHSWIFNHFKYKNCEAKKVFLINFAPTSLNAFFFFSFFCCVYILLMFCLEVYEFGTQINNHHVCHPIWSWFLCWYTFFLFEKIEHKILFFCDNKRQRRTLNALRRSLNDDVDMRKFDKILFIFLLSSSLEAIMNIIIIIFRKFFFVFISCRPHGNCLKFY